MNTENNNNNNNKKQQQQKRKVVYFADAQFHQDGGRVIDKDQNQNKQKHLIVFILNYCFCRLPLANSSFVENLHGRIFVLIIIRLKDKTLLSKKSNKAHYFSSNLVRVFIFWLVTYNAQDSNEWEKKKKEKHHQPTTDCHCGLVFGSISSRVWLALLWLYTYTSPLHNETCFKTKPAGRQQQTSTSAEKRIRKNRNWKSSPYTVGKPTKKRQAAKESMVEWPTGQERNRWFSPSFFDSRSDTAAKFICFGRRSKLCWNVCRVFSVNEMRVCGRLPAFCRIVTHRACARHE